MVNCGVSHAGAGTGNVFGIGNRVAPAKLVVRDAHLAAIGVGRERFERSVLGLPAEAADPDLVAHQVAHECGASADAVAITIGGIGLRLDRTVWNGLHQPRTEHGDGNATGHDVDTRPAPPMAGTPWQTEQLTPSNAGPNPSSAVSTSAKSSSPTRNSRHAL